jgi:hypothetical protein
MTGIDPKRPFSTLNENVRKWKYAIKPAAVNCPPNIQSLR